MKQNHHHPKAFITSSGYLEAPRELKDCYAKISHRYDGLNEFDPIPLENLKWIKEIIDLPESDITSIINRELLDLNFKYCANRREIYDRHHEAAILYLFIIRENIKNSNYGQSWLKLVELNNFLGKMSSISGEYILQQRNLPSSKKAMPDLAGEEFKESIISVFESYTPRARWKNFGSAFSKMELPLKKAIENLKHKSVKNGISVKFTFDAIEEEREKMSRSDTYFKNRMNSYIEGKDSPYFRRTSDNGVAI